MGVALRRNVFGRIVGSRAMRLDDSGRELICRECLQPGGRPHANACSGYLRQDWVAGDYLIQGPKAPM